MPTIQKTGEYSFIAGVAPKISIDPRIHVHRTINHEVYEHNFVDPLMDMKRLAIALQVAHHSVRLLMPIGEHVELVRITFHDSGPTLAGNMALQAIVVDPITSTKYEVNANGGLEDESEDEYLAFSKTLAATLSLHVGKKLEFIRSFSHESIERQITDFKNQLSRTKQPA